MGLDPCERGRFISSKRIPYLIDYYFCTQGLSSLASLLCLVIAILMVFLSLQATPILYNRRIPSIPSRYRDLVCFTGNPKPLTRVIGYCIFLALLAFSPAIQATRHRRPGFLRGLYREWDKIPVSLRAHVAYRDCLVKRRKPFTL